MHKLSLADLCLLFVLFAQLFQLRFQPGLQDRSQHHITDLTNVKHE